MGAHILGYVFGFIVVLFVPVLTTVRTVQIYRDAKDGLGEPVGFFGGIGMFLLGATAVVSWGDIILLVYTTYSGNPGAIGTVLVLPLLFVVYVISEGFLLISGPSR